MGIPGRERFRAIVLRYLETPGARVLRAAGFTPNGVTFLGFSVSIAAAAVVGTGHLLVGGIVFLAGSVLDLMDGALARLTGRDTRFGALLDSMADRLGEAALFLGMAIYGFRADLSDDRLLFFMVALILALATSQMVSYLRAKGEGLGVYMKAGLMTRPERVVLLSLGLIIDQRALEVVLIVIAAASVLTVLQRVHRIHRELTGGPEPAQEVDKRHDTL